MPPLGFTNPSLTPGQIPAIASYGYGAGMGPTAGSAGNDPYADVRKWQEYLAAVTEKALSEQNAFEKLKWQQQRDDAEKALANAMNIAKLQSETSRYGTDVQRQTELARLKENARQFDLNHGLAQADLGLKYADAYTRYASTYDDLFSLQDLKGAVANIQGGGGPAPYGSQGTPHAKNYGDFYALTGYGASAAGQGAAQGGGSTGTDPRVSAANAVMKALPPSETAGNDMQDWNAINAITSLYFGAKPGQVEALGQERQKAAQGALRRAGYNDRLVVEERNRSLPGQGSVRSY